MRLMYKLILSHHHHIAVLCLKISMVMSATLLLMVSRTSHFAPRVQLKRRQIHRILVQAPGRPLLA